MRPPVDTVSGDLLVAISANASEPIRVDRGPQRGGGLLERNGQCVDLARQLSALVGNDLVGGGLGRGDALGDGVGVRGGCFVAHGPTWWGGGHACDAYP